MDKTICVSGEYEEFIPLSHITVLLIYTYKYDMSFKIMIANAFHVNYIILYVFIFKYQ